MRLLIPLATLGLLVHTSAAHAQAPCPGGAFPGVLFAQNLPPTPDPGADPVYNAANTANLCSTETNGGVVSDYFAVSFNRVFHVPNWVAYMVNPTRMNNSTAIAADAQNTKYYNCCLQNNALSPLVQPAQYHFLGVNDRGHMAPYRSMQQALVSARDALLFTNIVPQPHLFNIGPWKTLESQIRTWAQMPGNTVYVIVGTIVMNPSAPPLAQWIGPAQHQIILPDKLYQIVVQAPTGGPTETSYYVFPNANTTTQPLANYKMTAAAFAAQFPGNGQFTFNVPP